ncbi:MAG: FkbM family methyltransferase [Planctomycetes bacterium]|nr:FkbM family methyltransferase [Planctomycetota bacterium]
MNEPATISKQHTFGRSATMTHGSARQQFVEQKYFIYSRIGHSQREMEFLPEGKIGRGAGACEQTWEVRDGNTGVVLALVGNAGVICELELDEGGVWRGDWLKFEKTPVALFPRQPPYRSVDEPAAADFQIEGLSLEYVGGIPLYCRPSTWDRSIAGEVISDDCYRLSSIVGRLNPSTIVDVGAHIGSFSCWAKSLWPSATILAFEPVPSNFQLLSRNTAALSNVVCKMCALHERRGISHIREGANTGGGRVGGEGTAILTLDTLSALKLQDMDKIDVLKLDCEGGEGFILDSLRESGRLQSVKYIVGEWHDSHLARVEGLKDLFEVETHSRGEYGYFWATRSGLAYRI